MGKQKSVGSYGSLSIADDSDMPVTQSSGEMKGTMNGTEISRGRNRAGAKS